MPEALYFTDSDEANELIAKEPLALLIGFALDQQITVQTAFAGPLKLKQRIGSLDAGAIASMDPQALEDAFRQRPGIHRFPRAMARRVQDLCAFVAEEYDGDAERVWTDATDAADLRRRIAALPGFGKMKVTALGSVLALRFGVETAAELVPELPDTGRSRLSRGARGVPGEEARTQGVAQSRSDRVTEAGPASAAIELTTLTDGGQRAADIARLLSGFLAQAEKSLDLAVYDVRFETDAGGLVLASLLSAVQRGVAVRLLYNVAHPGPIPVPPPPETGPEAIESLPIDTRGVAGIPDLMHHKYVVRDGDAVWTGSTNWTDDSWTRQENVIVTVRSPKIAYAYTLTFDQLWETGQVANTGSDPRPAAGERCAGARMVLSRARRSALSPGRQAHREGTRAGADRFAGAHLGPDPRHARRGLERAALRRPRRRRRHPGRPGLPPVADERRQRVEGAAPAARPRRAQRSAARPRSRGHPSR